MAPAESGDLAEQQLFDVLSALGFQPEREINDARELTYCLGNCPYRDVVRERQSLVCGLHRGMIRGLIETLDDSTELTAFVARDPDVAGCEVALVGPIVTAALADELSGVGD
jgi:predicted ArsR family transcriptional regulator